MNKSKINEKLKSYYENKKERKKLEYELNKLKELHKKIKALEAYNSEKYTNELNERKNLIEVRIMDIEFKLLDLAVKNIKMDVALLKLGEEEKELLEKRYYENKSVLTISKEIFLSTATISRKLSSILDSMSNVI